MINWNRRTYDEQAFRDAWLSSKSIAETARTLGLTIYGSTYLTLRHSAKELGLNEDHMTGQSWNSGDAYTHPVKPKPIADYLKNDVKVASSFLKGRLLKENILENKCSECGQEPEWNGKPLALQLDHINGDGLDNRLENLRILCGHCHSQTDTFCRGKRGEPKRFTVKHLCVECMEPCRFSEYWHRACNKCIDCGLAKNSVKLRCGTCNARNNLKKVSRATKIEWPSREELLDMLAVSNYTQVGKKLGVSDSAVRKRLNRK